MGKRHRDNSPPEERKERKLDRHSKNHRCSDNRTRKYKPSRREGEKQENINTKERKSEDYHRNRNKHSTSPRDTRRETRRDRNKDTRKYSSRDDQRKKSEYLSRDDQRKKSEYSSKDNHPITKKDILGKKIGNNNDNGQVEMKNIPFKDTTRSIPYDHPPLTSPPSLKYTTSPHPENTENTENTKTTQPQNDEQFLMEQFGLPISFNSTHGKKVQEDSGSFRLDKHRHYRQYMNRGGGFERHLDPEKGHKLRE